MARMFYGSIPTSLTPLPSFPSLFIMVRTLPAVVWFGLVCTYKKKKKKTLKYWVLVYLCILTNNFVYFFSIHAELNT